jgi:hypothetical protein
MLAGSAKWQLSSKKRAIGGANVAASAQSELRHEVTAMVNQLHTLSTVEGSQVSVALRDGTRIDDCNLVSSGRRRVKTLWLFANGEDVFVPIDDVIDLWETHATMS